MVLHLCWPAILSTRPALRYGCYTRCHSIKEKRISVFQQLSINRFLPGSATLSPLPLEFLYLFYLCGAWLVAPWASHLTDFCSPTEIWPQIPINSIEWLKDKAKKLKTHMWSLRFNSAKMFLLIQNQWLCLSNTGRINHLPLPFTALPHTHSSG